jgi:hypothetical protein
MSGRMTRFDWLDKVQPNRVSLLANLPGLPKPAKLPKLPKSAVTLTQWEVMLDNGGKVIILEAHTKSEARAELKKVIGGVIPPGTVIKRKV